MKILKYLIPTVIIGLLIGGFAYGASLIRPSGLNDFLTYPLRKGSIVIGSSTPDSFTQIPTSTLGSVLWMASTGLPAWTATSTLGISGGGGSGTISTSTNLTATQVVFATGASTIGSNANLFYNVPSQFLGIGTSSPWATLTVQGKATSTTSTYLLDVASSTGTSYLMVTNQGNVGIGTTTPGQLLSINGLEQSLTTRATGANFTGASGAGVELFYSGVGEVGSYNRTSSAYTPLDMFGSYISFSPSQVEKVRIDTNGNVGIGTTTPATKLYVAGGAVRIDDGQTYGFGASGLESYVQQTSNKFVFNNLQNSGYEFDTAGAGAAIRILDGGNVGIGTTTPTQKLQVNGSALLGSLGNTTGTLLFANSSNAFTTTLQSSTTQASSLTFTLPNTSGSSGQVLQTDGAGVMSWITASAGTVTGSGTIGKAARWTSTSALSTGILIDNGTVAGVNATSTSYTFNLQANSATAPLNVASSSGTSVFNLDRNGLAVFQAGVASTSAFSINNASSSPVLTVDTTSIAASPSSNIFSVASSSNGSLFNVNGFGNVGINTTTPGYKLVVVGTVQLPGLTTSAGLQTGVLCSNAVGEVVNDSVACLASARRFKTAISNLPVGLQELLQLQPVQFKWTKQFNKGFEKDPNKNGIQYSLIADDVQKIDPRMVTVETSGPDKGEVHGLADLNHWVALFVQSFKDMEQQIIDTQFKVNTQATKIEQMQKQLDKQQKQISLLLKFNK